MHIARQHLIPKQMRENGITEDNIELAAEGIKAIITGYTKEAGLRNLERELAAVCRKVAVRVARGEAERVVIDGAKVEELLGPRKHFTEELLGRDRVGIATGLAWTAVGGDLLFIEVVAVPGKGQLLLTGSLGDVMKESAQAALSYARAYSGAQSGIAEDFFAKHDIHVHVPAGSIPKDGPSAGITMGTAILSVLTQRPVNRRVAMTGEITLRGDVLPIGGLKEKVLAAKLAGIHTVIVPKLNRRDLVEIPDAIKKDLTFHFVEHMDEVLEIALLDRLATPTEAKPDPPPASSPDAAPLQPASA
jgi:ATP-dependent Lon protease